MNDTAAGEHLVQNFSQLDNYDLNVLVFNFVDILSHARTESKMIRELANDDEAYRRLTETWFRNSYALEIFKLIARKGWKVVLTTTTAPCAWKMPSRWWATRTPTPTCATRWART